MALRQRDLTQQQRLSTEGACVLAGVLTIGVAVAGGWVVARTQRVVVEGTSMEPTLTEGDRLLVVRGLRTMPGSLVALRDPRDAGRLLVKRVRSVSADGIDVRGDAPGRSTDSRTFGPVRGNAVLGRVVWRYAPPQRAGRVGTPPAGGASGTQG